MLRPWKLNSLLSVFSTPVKRRKLTLIRTADLLEHRTLLSFTLGTSKVKMADDYFAIEQGNLRDYTEPGSPVAGADDRVNAGDDDQGLTNPNVSGGAYNFTSTTSSQLYLVHPGVWDAERQPADRFAGTVPEDHTGETRPIDTSRYYMLNMKITASTSIPYPPTSFYQSVGGRIYWDNGRAVGDVTATRSYFLFPGTHLYSFDLSQYPIEPGVDKSGGWTGAMAGLRFFPVNVAGVNVSIDWVTLTGRNQSTVPISLSGISGTVQVGISVDGNPANMIKTNRPSGVWPDGYWNEEHFVPPTQASQLRSIDVSSLGAGTYYLHLLDANGNPIGGTTPQQLIVNAPGSARIQTPSAIGDLSRDYATTVRGDAWDFSQTSDFVMPFLVSPTEYGAPTIVTDPASSIYGQLSSNGNSWMRYDNFTASNPAHREDPQFLLPVVGGVNTSVYKNLTVRMLFDEKRPNSQIGGPLRFGYNDTNPPYSGFSQTDDIIGQDGPQNYSVNLTKVKLEPLFTTNRPYSSMNSVSYLRFDPHEYPRQIVTYVDQVWLTPNERTIDGRFNITWSSADLNGDGLTVSKIYLDSDRSRNGNEVLVATNVANTGSYTFDTRTVSGLQAGTYRVLFELNDGYNLTYEYSTGVLDVTPVGPTTSTPFYRAYNATSNFHFFTTNRFQFEAALNAGYRDEATAATGFAIPFTQVAGSYPLYRIYNLQRGFHYYTLNSVEKDILVNSSPQPGQPGFGQIGWRDEGVEGYMFATPQPGATEIFRLYNNQSGVHLFTEVAGIKNAILAQFPGIWVQHDSLGYAYPTGTGTNYATGFAAATAAAAIGGPISAPVESPAATAPASSNDLRLDTLIAPVVSTVTSEPPAAVNATAAEPPAPLRLAPLRSDDEASDDAQLFDSVLTSLHGI
jgi:hypothetical protein